MEQQRYKLTEAAKVLGMSPWTLRRWIVDNRIEVLRSPTGRIYLPALWIKEQLGQRTKSNSIRCALYARESSSENKTALKSQLEGLRLYAKAKGYQVLHEVTEFGSGLNDSRKRLSNLLLQKDFDVLLVEHKERLTRFGFKWFELLCPFKIEVINLAENGRDDLMGDLVAILTSFSARLYGLRRGRAKTKAAIKALKDGKV